MKRLIDILVATVLLATVAAAGFAGAYVIELYRGPPIAAAERFGTAVAQRWVEIFGLDRTDTSEDRTLRLSSIFLPLKGEVVPIPKTERQGAGGGLTSWGALVLVMTHEGTFYVIDGEHSVARLPIMPPINGFAAYVAAAKRPPFDKVQHDFSTFRYNDVAFFESDRRRGLLVSYTKFYEGETCYRTVVSRLIIGADEQELMTHAAATADWENIFETDPCLPLKQTFRAIEGHTAGGRLAYDGKSTVYLASGDYAWDGVYGPRVVPGANATTHPAVAQDPEADYGKVIAIDLESDQARQVSRGHRNMQGIALDGEDRVWVLEHGMRGGDELNLVVEGGNYGWPQVTYGTMYSSLPMPDTPSVGRHEKFRRPMISWLPSIATSALAYVEGFHDTWDGDLVAGSLKGRKLVRIRVADGRVIFTEFIEVGQRIRDVHQHTDGRLVLWTDGGDVIFLSPTPGGFGVKWVNGQLEQMPNEDGLRDRVRAALDGCMECHSLEPADHAGAPSLARMFGRPLGSTSFDGYSRALRNDPQSWTRELLASFLRDPDAAVPGTIMPDQALEDDAVIQGVIDLLEGLATEAETPPA